MVWDGGGFDWSSRINITKIGFRGCFVLFSFHLQSSNQISSTGGWESNMRSCISVELRTVLWNTTTQCWCAEKYYDHSWFPLFSSLPNMISLPRIASVCSFASRNVWREGYFSHTPNTITRICEQFYNARIYFTISVRKWSGNLITECKEYELIEPWCSSATAAAAWRPARRSSERSSGSAASKKDMQKAHLFGKISRMLCGHPDWTEIAH